VMLGERCLDIKSVVKPWKVRLPRCIAQIRVNLGELPNNSRS